MVSDEGAVRSALKEAEPHIVHKLHLGHIKILLHIYIYFFT